LKSRVPEAHPSQYANMTKPFRHISTVTAFCLASIFVASTQAVSLTPAHNQKFDSYVHEVEKSIQARAVQGRVSGFPSSPEGTDSVQVQSPAKDNPNDIGGAYIHDWVGRAFIPGGKASQLLTVLKDYNHHKNYYAPEVLDSKLVATDGEDLLSFLRIRRKKVLTVTLVSEYRNRFVDVGPGAGYSMSRSTSIREVENAEEANERELPHGEGNGFLWRLNAYWSWQETLTGLWVECRAVSLSRSTPIGLGWAVNPIVRSLPRESLESMIANTRKAVIALRSR
jgi:hypothetical protein